MIKKILVAFHASQLPVLSVFWIAGLSVGQSIGPLIDKSILPKPKYTTELLYHRPCPIEYGWRRLPSSLIENVVSSCSTAFTFTTVAIVRFDVFFHIVGLLKLVFCY